MSGNTGGEASGEGEGEPSGEGEGEGEPSGEGEGEGESSGEGEGEEVSKYHGCKFLLLSHSIVLIISSSGTFVMLSIINIVYF